MLAAIGLGGQEMTFLFVVLFYLIPIIPIWKILQKSGQNPWLCLIGLVPGAGLIIVLYVAAFSDWRVR